MEQFERVSPVWWFVVVWGLLVLAVGTITGVCRRVASGRRKAELSGNRAAGERLSGMQRAIVMLTALALAALAVYPPWRFEKMGSVRTSTTAWKWERVGTWPAGYAWITC